MTTAITNRRLIPAIDSWVNSGLNIGGTQDIEYQKDKGRYAFTGYLGQFCKLFHAQPGLPGVAIEVVAINIPGRPMDFRACLTVGTGPRKYSRRMRITRNLFTLLCTIEENGNLDMLDEAIAEVVILTGPHLFYPQPEEAMTQ